MVANIWAQNLLALKDYEKWLQQLVSPFTKAVWWEKKPDPSTLPFRLNARLNTRVFLSTLYFMLLFGEKFVCTEEAYKKTLQELRDPLLDIIAQAVKNLDSDNCYFNEEKSD